MAFEVTVLGASGTYPTPGSSCAGYLLRSKGADVWVDAGPGTFANLQRHTRFDQVRALVVSHLHPDHFLDVYPFYYALRYGLDSGNRKSFPVYAPSGAEEHLEKLLSSEESPGGFDGYLAFTVVAPDEELKIGLFQFRFGRSVHPIETLAMRVEAEGRVLAYTADTGPGGAIEDLAKGADTLICEATLQEEDEDLAEVHMTAAEAGALAFRTGVSRLVMTHIMPSLDTQRSVDQAREQFSGEILVAEDNLTFAI